MNGIRIGQHVRLCVDPELGGTVVAKTTSNAGFYRKTWADETASTGNLEYNSQFDGWYRVRFARPFDINHDGHPVQDALFMPGELVPA